MPCLGAPPHTVDSWFVVNFDMVDVAQYEQSTCRRYLAGLFSQPLAWCLPRDASIAACEIRPTTEWTAELRMLLTHDLVLAQLDALAIDRRARDSR